MLGLPSIDPLLISSMTIKQGADRPVNIELKFKNADFIGLRDIEFKSMK